MFKRTLIAVLLAVVSINMQSQTNAIWGKQFGTDQEEYVRNHLLDKNGFIYVSGNTKGVISEKNYGKNDGFLSKIDSSGNIMWSRQFGSSEDEDIQWSAMDSKGFIYILGTTSGVIGSNKFGKEDIFLVKYSSDGQKIWANQYGSDSTDIATGIYINKKGNIYLAGSTMGKMGDSAFGNQDAIVMKLDNDGTPEYVKQFGSAGYDGCNAVTGDTQDNLYIVGSTFGILGTENKGLMDIYTGIFSEKDMQIKFSQFGSEGFDVPTSILADDKNNIYVGGTTSGNLAGQQMGEGDCFLTKLTNEGTLVWNKQFGTDKHDGIKGLAFNPKNSDHILVSGLQNLPPAHAFVRMYKKDGNLLWEKKLIPDGSNKDASGKDVSIDNMGNIYHIGLTASELYGAMKGVTDYYIVKIKLDKRFLNQ